MDNASLDINKYRKLNFEDIKNDLEMMKVEENISRTSLTEWFSNRVVKQPDGSVKIEPAKYRTTDYFDLPKNFLGNQPNEQKNTTIGSYLYNAFVLCNAFNNKVRYYDKPLNKNNFEEFQKNIANAILQGSITVDEFAKYSSMAIWLSYFTELFMPGISLNFIVPNKELMEYKKKLLEENKDLLNKKTYNSDDVALYMERIENPLKAKARELLKDDPTLRLYDLAKPSFDNNYKNSNVINGPLYDPVSGEYKINTNSYNEGITRESFDVLANKAMTSSFSRAVATQDGGTMTKYLSVAMQNVKLGPKGSDCGTDGYILYKVDSKRWESILYDYMINDDKTLTCITPELKKSLVGKVIKLRTPLYCTCKDYFCNHCAGDRYYKLGIKDIGMTATITTGTIMQKNMKAMHDVSVKTTSMNISDLIDFEN